MLNELEPEQLKLVKKKYHYYRHNNKNNPLAHPDLESWYRANLERGKDPTGDMRLQRGPNWYSQLRFYRHRAQAKYRKIEFEFTWEEWHAWWLDHGIDRNEPDPRRGADRLCMARCGDTGPYRADNVYLTTVAQNNTDAAANGLRRNVGRPKGARNKPKG